MHDAINGERGTVIIRHFNYREQEIYLSQSLSEVYFDERYPLYAVQEIVLDGNIVEHNNIGTVDRLHPGHFVRLSSMVETYNNST